MRDDFTQKTKNALALRANYKCSFTGCGVATSGPSDESLMAVAVTGVAAHIHAAAPGGRRYLENMTPEDRSAISNGIWLCQNHATLIDRDSTNYTADVIRQMKSDHERRIASEQSGCTKSTFDADFVAIGPNLVFTGELIGFNGTEWQFSIHHFLIGDISTLIMFSERFEQINSNERYVLVNSLGDGRQLASAPAWNKSASGYDVVSCMVRQSFPRMRACDLPSEWALNDAHDVFMEKGRWAMVSGVDALPQRIKSCLSLQLGESPLHPDFGARITEYFYLFKDSPHLQRLIKLEVIRQACVPYTDPCTMHEYTPLMRVLRVMNIDMLPSPGTRENWLPFRFQLDIEGLGHWQRDISVCIPGCDK